MTTIQKQIIEKQTGYRKSLPDMLKLITDNRRSDDDEAYEKWSQLPKFCEECGEKMDLSVRSGFPRKRKSKG